jgi:hypothetical protein
VKTLVNDGRSSAGHVSDPPLSLDLRPRPRESSPHNQLKPYTIKHLSQFHTVLISTLNSRATFSSDLPSPIHSRPWTILYNRRLFNSHARVARLFKTGYDGFRKR